MLENIKRQLRRTANHNFKSEATTLNSGQHPSPSAQFEAFATFVARRPMTERSTSRKKRKEHIFLPSKEESFARRVQRSVQYRRGDADGSDRALPSVTNSSHLGPRASKPRRRRLETKKNEPTAAQGFSTPHNT